MSLTVILTTLSTRLFSVPWSDVAPRLVRGGEPLAGDPGAAWVGAAWTTRMRSATQYRVLAVLIPVLVVLLVASSVKVWRHE
jgi:uncharacterized protein